MLTGYGPLETGEITQSGKRSVPPGMTVYERIAAARPEVKTVHIAGRKFVGRGIIRWARYDEALDLDMRRGGRDNYTGDNTTDQFLSALDFVGTSPFFLFVHYKAADVVAHRVGDGSKQYREAIVQNDQQLGAVMDMLAARGLLSSTEILVTTDHGFEGIFHVNLEKPTIVNTWLASRTSALGSGPATVLDVTPTILDLLDISMTNADPPYRGVSQVAQPAP
jgi:predicted AlkP superfamily pyrophosphatase or phosphodiesterase